MSKCSPPFSHDVIVNVINRIRAWIYVAVLALRTLL